MAEDTYFQGTVPSPNVTNVRDAAYRSFRLGSPLETVLSYDPTNTVDTNWATTGTAYYGAPPPLSDGGPDFRSLYVLGRYYHTVQFVSSNVSAYSARVQGSLDGLVWTDLGAGATSSDAIVSFTGLYKYLRLHATTI